MSWPALWSVPGALAGLLVGVGVWLVLLGLPANRQPDLVDRLAPYLRDTRPPSRLLTADRDNRSGLLAALTRPLVRDLARWVERIMGGAASVRRRLQLSLIHI